MKKIIIIWVIIISLLLVGCSDTDRKIVSVDKDFKNGVSNFSEKSLVRSSNVTPPNYSEEGYIKVYTNGTKIVYFECINSTLTIQDNQISCEGRVEK